MWWTAIPTELEECRVTDSLLLRHNKPLRSNPNPAIFMNWTLAEICVFSVVVFTKENIGLCPFTICIESSEKGRNVLNADNVIFKGDKICLHNWLFELHVSNKISMSDEVSVMMGVHRISARGCILLSCLRNLKYCNFQNLLRAGTVR